MELNRVLQIILGEFRDKLKTLNNIVERDAHFPQAPNKIKVAIGMRRVGKTYFVYNHILQLLETGIPFSSILYINFEDYRLFPLQEKKLAALVDEFYALYPENHDRKCFLFFDEIQNVPNWPVVIRRLHDTKNVEIFLTGSSAKMLNKEISISLRGRSLAIEIWPYSFREFIRAKKINIDKNLYSKKKADILRKNFYDYLAYGGFPEVISYEPDIKQRTLQEYLDVAVYRDIIERHDIKNPVLIKFMIFSMIHNVGKMFALNKFYNDVKSQGFSIGKDLLYKYAEHIEDSYLAFLTPMYHKSIRKKQTNPKKIYAIDSGLIRATTLDYENDLGRVFENIIYLDLRRLGCKINTLQTSDGFEVDFFAQTARGQKKLFQVAWETNNKSTMEREQRALNSAIKETKIDGELITLESYLEKGISI